MIEFIITALEALALIAMAALVFNSHRNRFLNRYFALFLVFLALWVLCGFPQALVQEPSDYFITLVFRLAHCMAVLATGIFFLFGLGFYLGRAPGRTWRGSVLLATAIMAFCSLSDLIVRSVSYDQGRFYITNGTAFPLFPAFMILCGGGGLLCIALKRRESIGPDRARATYILLGFGIFLGLAILLVIVLPGIMGSDITSDYTFFLVIIPTGFTAYAILKHHLLDVRLAIRRSFAYLLTLIIFGAPIFLSYMIFRFAFESHPNLETAISIIALALAVALSPSALRWSNRIAARLFFSGLYDEVGLLHEVSSIFTSTANIREGLAAATAIICDALGLKQLQVAIPEEATRGKGNWVIGCVRREKDILGFQEVEVSASPLFLLHDPMLLDDDANAGVVEDVRNAAMLLEMRSRGIIACLPVRGPGGNVGILMVGRKVKRRALDPMDVDLLHRFCERAGLFIENYLLSSYLLSMFEELSETRKRLEESDRFKTDIINVTSHELRTPLTILNGYAFMLQDHYERFAEDERRQYLTYITASCERLNAILDQFLTVSRFQAGAIRAALKPTDLLELLAEVKAGFIPEQGRRIESDAIPLGVRVLTDRSYLLLMLKNLIENAIRFSPSEMPIIIKAEEKEREVMLSIHDFGEGIAQEELQDIFQPFTRLEEIDKHQVGTGLGLYIVRLIADLLSVTVDVESEPQEGTVFRLTLPHA
ncbi:MAG: hypothetical protein C4536_15250 [Actinobacteria bacterium]|jgi:signal transduction histidine kinase|nr:MAG: hypothetical protein C4536_15250 [Actinomycetota bacterium]